MNKKTRRSVALIINYWNNETEIENVQDIDIQNLKNTLEGLNFKVEYRSKANIDNNFAGLCSKVIKKRLSEKDVPLEEFDCFLCIIVAYQIKINETEKFVTADVNSDGQEIPINHIINSVNNMEELANKPKMFMLQGLCITESTLNSSMQTDAQPFQEISIPFRITMTGEDTLIVYSSIFGNRVTLIKFNREDQLSLAKYVIY